MKPPEIVAVCGPRCTECDAYKASRSGRRADLEALAAQWTLAMGKVFTADDVYCDGCRVENRRRSSYCATCEIRRCALARNLNTCAECPGCPCILIVAPRAREALQELRSGKGCN